MTKILIYDTETSGLPNFKAPALDPAQPRIIQLAYASVELCEGERGSTWSEPTYSSDYIYHQKLVIPKEAAAIHGISQEKCRADGLAPFVAMEAFVKQVQEHDVLIAYNNSFDNFLLKIECAHAGISNASQGKKLICAMRACTDICQLPTTAKNKNFGFKYKNPKLQEAHNFFFGEGFEGAHDALADVKATLRIVQELYSRQIIQF